MQEFLRGSPASLASCPENSFPARPQRGHPHGGSTETPRWSSFRTTGPRCGPGAGKVRVSQNGPASHPKCPETPQKNDFGAAISTWPMNAARDVVVSGQLR